MEAIKAYAASGAADLATDAATLSKLSEDVNQVMLAHNVAGPKCRTECSVQIVIGPDGRPQPTLVCKVVCDW